MKQLLIPGGILYNGDCIVGAKQYIKDNSIDLIITDPPYGIQGDMLHHHYNRDERFVVQGYVEVSTNAYEEFSHAWIKEAARILRPGGSIYIISGYTNLYHILSALRQTELVEINHIIWKYNFGVFTKKKYISSHYHILYYEKIGGNRTFQTEVRFGLCEKDENGGSCNYQDRGDVWIMNREFKPGKIKNKNELPYELLVKMMQYSSQEGDQICDLFLGGCSTAKVAIGLNRKIIGFEISPTIFDIKTKEVETIIPGSMLSSLRIPVLTTPGRRGKRWSSEERQAVHKRYHEFMQAGMSKTNAISTLEKEFERGRFSLSRCLKEDIPDERENQNER
ncbi:MAG: site-specific DNA-methyltransferase [Methanomicrobiales archaeon]|jgi:site-specific DNA-methyltransferase (adenine-specific)|nr:site-specific DNA-methyltransferase [Methanomicrobiales archaeon]